MKFNPSPYSYGYGATEEGVEEDSALDTLSQYSPILSDLLSSSARTSAAKVEAKIENLKALKKATGSQALKTIYTMRINTLKAKLVALQEQAEEERTAETTTQLGKLGGTALLVSGAVLGIGILWYLSEKVRTERWKRTAAGA